MMLPLVASLVTLVVGTVAASSAEAEPECALDSRAQPAHPGGAMLQFASDHAAPKTAGHASGHAELVEEGAKRAASRGIGASADLMEEGYTSVAATCCVREMEEFARRLVADLGLVICDEGGLSGTVGFHTCEKGAQSFAKLTEDVKNSEHGQCAWTAKPGHCGDIDRASCGLPPDGFHRRRVCSDNANADTYMAAEVAPPTSDDEDQQEAEEEKSTEPAATEAPATEAPATGAPATEAPAAEVPYTETPATEAPATEAPATEAPYTEAPATGAPATEAPATEAPATEAPATEAPATEAPATEAPATEAPATEAPATEAPATEAPATFPPMQFLCVRQPPGTNSCQGGESEASVEECKFCSQSSHLGGTYSGEINFATAARGCYQFTDDGRVFFNTHSSGGSRTSDDVYCVMKR